MFLFHSCFCVLRIFVGRVNRFQSGRFYMHYRNKRRQPEWKTNISVFLLIQRVFSNSSKLIVSIFFPSSFFRSNGCKLCVVCVSLSRTKYSNKHKENRSNQIFRVHVCNIKIHFPNIYINTVSVLEYHHVCISLFMFRLAVTVI